jgi:hypothetical protein
VGKEKDNSVLLELLLNLLVRLLKAKPPTGSVNVGASTALGTKELRIGLADQLIFLSSDTHKSYIQNQWAKNHQEKFLEGKRKTNQKKSNSVSIF